MRKIILMLVSVLIISTETFSSERYMENLASYIKEKPGIVPYMKDIVNIPNRDAIMADIISPDKNHHNVNFENVSQQLFGEDYWTPKQTVFTDQDIEELLKPYKPKLKDMDIYNVFLGNLLYFSGSQFYKATKNSEFLEYAASIGHSGAQYEMFFVALKSKKFLEAKNYLLSSAAQKNSEALLKLSDVYQGGYQRLLKDFTKDVEMSRKLCKESALLKNHIAEFKIEVATLTEGFFGSKINYQNGIRKAKELATSGNKYAEEFIDTIMQSSSDSLMEGNESITKNDLDFLKQYLDWKED